MKTLDKLRDELASEDAKHCDPEIAFDYRQQFIVGWDAALKALSEQAGDEPVGEWSRDDIRAHLPSTPKYWADRAIVKLLERIEQDRARIGLAETKLACVLVNNGKLKTEREQAERERDIVEGRLKDRIEELVTENFGLLERVRELEKQYQELYEITHEQMNADGKRIAELEGRIYEITKDWPHIKLKERK